MTKELGMERQRRRRLLLGIAAAPVGLAFARPADSAVERVLAFRHTHTGERLELVYFAGGEYVPAALARIDWLLRDFRTGEVHRIDSRLLDTLHRLCATCGGREFEIISAYRSGSTNARLRAGSDGVAERSLHLVGRAIDIRLPGFSTARLRDAAVALGAGGVGYYPKSDFVHLDTGRVRRWGPA